MSIPYSLPSRLASLLAALLIACSTGCCFGRKVTWIEPVAAAPLNLKATSGRHDPVDVESLYATAISHQQQCLSSCVDLFYEVALLTARHETCVSGHCRGRALHRSALQNLVKTGQQFGRFDPHQGLTIQRAGTHVIPIDYRGFVWQPHDFHQLVAVGDYQTKTISKKHRCDGIGVPLVIRRCDTSEKGFLPKELHFAATLRLNLGQNASSGDAALGCRLELYDPLRIDHAIIHGTKHRLAKDLTAPLAYALKDEQRTYLDGFLNTAASSSRARLYTLEPYQPGKIPVVLIHGLLSDPFTWVEMVNELRAHPGLVNDFQIWVYEYPTGQAFLSSAAKLRQRLVDARHSFDPTHRDRHLSNTVLIGHSLGGLIAKLQVTFSDGRLWRSVANRPFDQVAMDDRTRQKLSESFFFRPSDLVSRAIFIATPHRGSMYARRLIGKIGASLVQVSEEDRQAHERLMRCNPGVFSKEVSRRIPTSIDLLNPDSGLLMAIEALPVSRRVCMHSIIGDHRGTLFHGRTDGVVPVNSAREHRAVTELVVDSKHTGVNEHPGSIEEVLAILYEQRRQVSHDLVDRPGQLAPFVLDGDSVEVLSSDVRFP